MEPIKRTLEEQRLALKKRKVSGHSIDGTDSKASVDLIHSKANHIFNVVQHLANDRNKRANKSRL